MSKKFYVDGVLHRNHKPAKIVFCENGSIEQEEFYVHGKLHRDPGLGPAKIVYHKNWGTIMFASFFTNGLRHREDGPSVINYSRDGSICMELFHLDGKFIGNDKEGFWALWDSLNEEERKNPKILNMLSIYS
jgi:antitoxin component YwqK of YwqJK toxin-antitoxin module